MTFLNLFEFINEGYKGVKQNLIQNIPTISSNEINFVLNNHKSLKEKFPEEMKNIDLYFSKNNQAKTNKSPEQLFKDLKNKLTEVQASIPTKTKKENKINKIEKLKIAENNEYVLFKVPTWEDAVNLKRIGKNNPWNLPSMIPVDWCITANSAVGKHIFENYTIGNRKFDYEKSIIIYNIISNFFFGFKKNTKNQTTFNSKDFVAISYYIDGNKFRYTPTPNRPYMINRWPSNLPTEWQNICKANSDFTPKTSKMSVNDWKNAILSNPNIALYCDVWDQFNNQHWMNLLSAFPQLAKYCNKWDIFNTENWINLLKRSPELAKYCNKWNEFDVYEWVEVLSKQPQFIDKCNKLDEFDEVYWYRLVNLQPQFKDLAKKYGFEFSENMFSGYI